MLAAMSFVVAFIFGWIMTDCAAHRNRVQTLFGCLPTCPICLFKKLRRFFEKT